MPLKSFPKSEETGSMGGAEWTVAFSVDFKKTLKQIKLHKSGRSDLKESISRWVCSENDLFIETSSNKKVFVNAPWCVFEIRLGSVQGGKKTGKSSGYRLIMVYNEQESTAEVGQIYQRKDLEHKQAQEKKAEYLRALRKRIDIA